MMKYSDDKIKQMRKGGKILSRIVDRLIENVNIGVNKKDIEKQALAICKEYNVRPNFLGYQGYPSPICIMVNDEVMHTIPRNHEFKSDDLVSLDMGIEYQGYQLDMARSISLGNNKLNNDMISVSKGAVELAISMARNGMRIGNIGYYIEKYVTSRGFFIVKELAGHGIGKELHMEPVILNFGKLKTGPKLSYGDTIAIEVIISDGSGEIYMEEDGWSLKTVNRKKSVTWENTVMVGDTSGEVLTKE